MKNNYSFSDDGTQIILKDRRGHVCIMSAEDEQLLKEYRFSRNASGYFETRKNYQLIRLHRLVSGAKQGDEVDHANGKPWDNRRDNLRICSHAQNLMNKRVQKNNALKVKGVFRAAGRVAYTAKIRVDGKTINLGQHKTIGEAKTAYDNAALKYFKEFSRK